MSAASVADAQLAQKRRRNALDAWLRFLRYATVRAITLGLVVVVAVYLTVLIANMGGKVDQIRLAQIEEEIGLSFLGNPQVQMMSVEERAAYRDQLVQLEVKRLGLDQPLLVRSFRYLKQGLTLNLGRSEELSSDSGSRQVRYILLERLPATLLLWGTAQILLFFLALFTALFLSGRYGSIIDKIVVALAPTSAAPGWFYGIFFILIFAAVLGWLPFGGIVDAPVPDNRWEYALSVLRHLVLPTAAQFASGLFLLIYSWRTFFLIYSSEDYVEMARAKGLKRGAVERRYILRPTLPYIITNFALLLISVWTGGIILETVFNWPGLGRLLYSAIHLYDTPVIVGSTVLYAYLLAATVFLLDIIYALVDPRVRVGTEGRES
ncbi:MAG TPA: ABC transporter permease [Firmicutes bacterium]|nr:ABC transporter permease [Bacillota bacterium]